MNEILFLAHEVAHADFDIRGPNLQDLWSSNVRREAESVTCVYVSDLLHLDKRRDERQVSGAAQHRRVVRPVEFSLDPSGTETELPHGQFLLDRSARHDVEVQAAGRVAKNAAGGAAILRSFTSRVR